MQKQEINFQKIRERLLNGPRLNSLLPYFEKIAAKVDQIPSKNRAAFEFRHPSWFTPSVYQLLRKKGAALVVADTPHYPLVIKSTTNFVYLRLHGHERLYASCYTSLELQKWASRLKRWLSLGKDVLLQ